MRDNGAGIPPEHQTEIFDEFFQIENRARDPNAGLGLGLAIAHRIARLLGANISLRSAKGHGSVFALTLPVVAGKVMAPVVAQESPAIPPLLLLDAGGRWENTDDLAERARRWGYEGDRPEHDFRRMASTRRFALHTGHSSHRKLSAFRRVPVIAAQAPWRADYRGGM